MKRKILTVLAILLGLAGLGVLLYPSVSNWMEQAKQRRQIAAYQEAQAQMEQKRRAALLAEADRYNQKLAELGISFDMLGEAEKEALLIDGKSYDELLLAEDSGVMGYLEIEKNKAEASHLSRSIGGSVGIWSRSSGGNLPAGWRRNNSCDSVWSSGASLGKAFYRSGSAGGGRYLSDHGAGSCAGL